MALAVPGLAVWLCDRHLSRVRPRTLGQGLTSLAIGQTPVGVVALVLLARPPVSALFAWGVLGEAMTGLQMVGGAIILIAVPMSQSG